MSEQWEYLTTVIRAEAAKKDAREQVKRRWPNLKRVPRYAPEALSRQLDDLGSQGWELVNMEPVRKVGQKGDILFGDVGWSNSYFCVFKRRRPVSTLP
ncbi:MAG TPA: DUF4177 domain-containing protein [Phototrophicaceae bacterium]|nr:DUF4177 domain-containing protein [Phototrophicaceae bacterium]